MTHCTRVKVKGVFMSGGQPNGTKLKILVVIDEFTRENLALEAATSIKSRSVQAILARLIEKRGAPSYLRSDNGPEFIARTLKIWLGQSGI